MENSLPLHRSWTFITVFSSAPTDFVMSYMLLVHHLISTYVYKVHFNVLQTCMPLPSKHKLPFLHKYSLSVTWSDHLILIWLLGKYFWEYKFWSSSLSIFLQSRINSTLLTPNNPITNHSHAWINTTQSDFSLSALQRSVMEINFNARYADASGSAI
jgi:hypothetical protein